jgi:2,4-diaminopentanoate dehydrogenase
MTLAEHGNDQRSDSPTHPGTSAVPRTNAMTRSLRVVQWTTGRTGSAAVKAMTGHPVLELVGCYAHSPSKVGQDVGTLSGMDPIGLTATDDVEELLGLRPDCVSYMPFRPDFDHLERILSSGVNVVTTMYMLAGHGYGDTARARIREAALRGGSSLYASGIYPGHVPMMALATTAMCRRIDRLSVLESLDVAGYRNEPMFRAMGFDLPTDDPEAPALVERSCGSFRDQIGVMAQALQVDLDGVRFSVEFAAANQTVDFGFMTLHQGNIAGFRGVVAGIVKGHSVIECRFVWKLGDDMTPNWPVTNGYVVDVEGDPSVSVHIGPPEGDFDGAVTTAMPCINAIPTVCAAPPGIVNQMDLPFVRGSYLIRPGPMATASPSLRPLTH